VLERERHLGPLLEHGADAHERLVEPACLVERDDVLDLRVELDQALGIVGSV
jgi:hypothetical protein